MKMHRRLIMAVLTLLISSCATHNPNKPVGSSNKQVTIKEVATPSPAAPTAQTRVIDYPSVQRLLKLNPSFTELGFFEKPFNTCEVGFGYAPDSDCQKKYFTVIHFKLVCRDSEGTISTILTDNDLKAIRGENVNWYLKNVNGSTLTDSEGYGQIITTTSESQRNQRLRLAVGADFLLTKASEAKRLIAPANWCNH